MFFVCKEYLNEVLSPLLLLILAYTFFHAFKFQIIICRFNQMIYALRQKLARWLSIKIHSGVFKFMLHSTCIIFWACWQLLNIMINCAHLFLFLKSIVLELIIHSDLNWILFFFFALKLLDFNFKNTFLQSIASHFFTSHFFHCHYLFLKRTLLHEVRLWHGCGYWLALPDQLFFFSPLLLQSVVWLIPS